MAGNFRAPLVPSAGSGREEAAESAALFSGLFAVRSQHVAWGSGGGKSPCRGPQQSPITPCATKWNLEVALFYPGGTGLGGS